MGIKKQFAKLKENWLIIVLAVVLFVVVSGGSGLLSGVVKNVGLDSQLSFGEFGRGVSDSMEMGYYPGISNSGFAPEAEERKVVKTASLSTEIERGFFSEKESDLKEIITLSDSFLLNERVSKYGSERKFYYQGSYQLKVDTEKYNSVISQLKEIGTVESFNENMADVTGRYENLGIEIEVEKQRLLRYNQIYDDAKTVSEKIELSDRIFNQERTIKYLEDSLKNIDLRIEYSTIYFSMNEKRSEYYDVVLVKFSSLVKILVGSFNNLIQFVFVLIPWGVALLVLKFGWKFFKKR